MEDGGTFLKAGSRDTGQNGRTRHRTNDKQIILFKKLIYGLHFYEVIARIRYLIETLIYCHVYSSSVNN